HAALHTLWTELAGLGQGALRGMQAWGLLAHDGQAATRALAQALDSAAPREGRQPWPLQDRTPPWRLAMALAAARQALQASRLGDPRASRLLERTQGPAQVLHALLSAPETDGVWLDWRSREDWSGL